MKVEVYTMQIDEEFNIQIPCGYKYNPGKSKNSTAVFTKEVKTWEDLPRIEGYCINEVSGIYPARGTTCEGEDENIARTEKHCKMMLAIAQISQLLPYYGGEFTLDEKRSRIKRYTIDITPIPSNNLLGVFATIDNSGILSFHTRKQAEDFLKHNERLVRDYYMLD